MSSSAVKRILLELKQIADEHEPYFRVYPVGENVHEVHFTFLGPPATAYENGLYHGLIILPQDYPSRPPQVRFCNPSGRFETHKAICTTFTDFHPETWNPTWGIRNIVVGLRSLFDEETPGSLGSILAAPEVREKYAIESHGFICKVCGCNHKDLVGQLSEIRVEKESPSSINFPSMIPSLDKTTSNSQAKTGGDGSRSSEGSALPPGVSSTFGSNIMMVTDTSIDEAHVTPKEEDSAIAACSVLRSRSDTFHSSSSRRNVFTVVEDKDRESSSPVYQGTDVQGEQAYMTANCDLELPGKPIRFITDSCANQQASDHEDDVDELRKCSNSVSRDHLAMSLSPSQEEGDSVADHLADIDEAAENATLQTAGTLSHTTGRFTEQSDLEALATEAEERLFAFLLGTQQNVDEPHASYESVRVRIRGPQLSSECVGILQRHRERVNRQARD
ncbi:Ubiquitin-conjugating enzyme E2 [Giardia muris]|uniref:Ubiquitin-conjugating enzyme E2 n=1 Tax=Giardia muris TaxID=5742 RepID=A0A4Z1T320_GIAMU|nr:Ubiquitin-conjugating enzyme E2 [Giardia muris]|eukprot:TNJ26811.1 Ubiquitin-conjugating enzyme E2 [Giardia muris]